MRSEPYTVDRWLLNMLTRASVDDDMDAGCQRIADELCTVLDCRQVAVGLVRTATSQTILQAISGLKHFDRQSEVIRCTEAVMDEVLIKTLTTNEHVERSNTSTEAHRRLARLTHAESVIGIPLRRPDGTIVGICLVMGNTGIASCAHYNQVLNQAALHIGPWLHLIKHAQPDMLSRWKSWITAARSKRTTLTIILATIVGTLALPVPYKIKCHCEVQPITRRWVAVPYDGRVEEIVAKPGDLVTKGQLLARMDGHEIRLELSRYLSDYNRANLQKDVSLAAHDTSTAQISALEMERLQLSIQLLTKHAENLEIRSPIAGMIISDDQHKAQGARMSMGQVLFEVAPLDRMTVELGIPDHEITHVERGQTVKFRLKGHPDPVPTSTIQRIHPRAEIREDANVFIAESPLTNTDTTLRPGMRGQAKIVAARHCLGWNLFHRAWDRMIVGLVW